MLDARLSTELPAHPKTKKLVRRIGQGGAWCLVCLILWTRANRPDGDLMGMTREDIELAVDWAGKDGEFVQAMADVGFLEGTDGTYRFHDWADHQPWAVGADARSEKAKWAAICRRHGRVEAAKLMPEYAERLLLACDEHATSSASPAKPLLPVCPSSTAPSPSPSPSPRARALPSSLRSDSSSAIADDRSAGGEGSLILSPPPADLAAAKAEQLRQITVDAVEAYNEILGKPNGLLAPVIPRVGYDRRQKDVKRCLKIARDISRDVFKTQAVTRAFWEAYFTQCAEDPHKSGRLGGGKGHENWLPDFEYLTRPDVMLSVFEKAMAA